MSKKYLSLCIIVGIIYSAQVMAVVENYCIPSVYRFNYTDLQYTDWKGLRNGLLNYDPNCDSAYVVKPYILGNAAYSNNMRAGTVINKDVVSKAVAFCSQKFTTHSIPSGFWAEYSKGGGGKNPKGCVATVRFSCISNIPKDDLSDVPLTDDHEKVKEICYNTFAFYGKDILAFKPAQNAQKINDSFVYKITDGAYVIPGR